jgi:hypothetical protein
LRAASAPAIVIFMESFEGRIPMPSNILLDHAVFHAYSFRDGLIEHMEILNTD